MFTGLGEASQTPVVYFLSDMRKPLVGFYPGGTIQDPPGGLYKTTDGGYTWKNVCVYGGTTTDITFKDSLTGWFCEEDGGVYKTTDGGDSWFSLPETIDLKVLGIYYDKKSDGLFLSNCGNGPTGVDSLGDYNIVSWDEGLTWDRSVFIDDVGTAGYAFLNDDSGIMVTPWTPEGCIGTTDAGITWYQINMDSGAWQPLAIVGTSTYFLNTIWGTIMRSDDAGNTWRILYTFPAQYRLTDGEDILTSSGCIRGTLDSLYVMVCDGCYLSTDQGVSWKYLCGMPDLATPIQRFFVENNGIYVVGVDSLVENGENFPTRLWMLNLDSMNTFSLSTTFTFSDSTTHKTVTPGQRVTVNFSPQTTDPIGIDSGHIVIHFDSTSLTLDSLEIPPAWVVYDSSSGPGYVNLYITADSSQPLPNPILTLIFSTYLSSSTQAKVWLDSANLSGHRLNCDCAVASVSGPDSVQINFTGCGDSILLAVMNDSLPFTIESIVPNPTTDAVQISIINPTSSAISYQVFDALGQSRLSGMATNNVLSFDVSSLPSGIYYLRFSSDGYVQTRSISVAR